MTPTELSPMGINWDDPRLVDQRKRLEESNFALTREQLNERNRKAFSEEKYGPR